MTTWLPDSSVFKMFQVMRPDMRRRRIRAPPLLFGAGHSLRTASANLFGSNFDARLKRGDELLRPQRAGRLREEKSVTGYGPTKANWCRKLHEARRKDLQRDFVNFHDGFKTELGLRPREYLLTFGLRR